MKSKLLCLVLTLCCYVPLMAQGISVEQLKESDISFQSGSRATESQISQLDVLRIKFAGDIQNQEARTAFKGLSHSALSKNVKHYLPENTGSNGLSEVFVRFIEEDAQGNLYFSGFGIDRFNGYEWENFSPFNTGIPTSAIYDMLEDRYGNLWLATFIGLVRVDHNSGEMRLLRVEDGMRSNLVLALHESKDGFIYAGHRWDEEFGGGITVVNYDGIPDQYISGEDGLYGDSVEDFAEYDGKIYVATAADPTNGEFGSISVIDAVTHTVITAYHKDNSDVPYNEFTTVEVDNMGNIWAGYFTNAAIGHNEGGIVKFDGENWTHYSAGKGQAVGVSIRDIESDGNGNLWIAALDGLFKYDGSTFSKVEADTQEGIPVYDAADVKALSDGRIAITTFFRYTGSNGGVYFYNPADDSWEYMSSSTDGGANSRVYFGAGYDSKGNLWATGFFGLQKFDGQNWETWTAADGMGHSYGWKLIVDSNDNVWVNNAEEGLIRINADGSMDKISEHGIFVETNYEDSNGGLWFGDYIDDYDGNGSYESNGILYYDGTSFSIYDSTDGLPGGIGGAVTDITEDQQGRILAATWSGLYRLEDGTFTKWEFPGYSNGDVYRAFLDSQDRLWINEAGRLVMYDGINWTYYGTETGFSGYAEGITEDMNGRVWFSQPDHALVYENGVFYNVSARDGLPLMGSIYDLAPSKSEAGTMAFAYYNGGLAVMNSEVPIAISSVMDNPDDNGGWIRIGATGYLLNPNFTGAAADIWRVEYHLNDEWQAASPVLANSDKAITVQVPVTKPTGVDADESNSYNFRIVALNDEEGIVGISETVTAFAEDNIAPAEVQGLSSERIGDKVSLQWQPNTENDIKGYAVFAPEVSDFMNTEPIGFTSSNSIEIEDDGLNQVQVAAVDIHNNYGKAVLNEIGTSTEVNSELPDAFALEQNYPNPFNPVTKISYALPQSSHTRITVYNSIGQQVAVLVNTVKPAGVHEVNFDAAQLNSGMYIYRIEAGSFNQTRKMMLIK